MKPSKKIKGPLSWVPTTWFAMGLPFVALSAASSIMYKDLGLDDREITFWTSMIMWPYTLNFFWSPWLEMYRTKKFFIYTTQAVTGILFGLVALSLHLPDFFAVSIGVMAMISFSGATHDVAANGFYLDALDKKKQASFVGWQGAFYNIAKVVASGLLVYVAGIIQKSVGTLQAWTIVMIVYGAIMCTLAFYNSQALPVVHPASEDIANKKNLRDILISFFKKPAILLSILFIIFYRFAEGQAIKIVPLFLKASKEAGGLALSNKDFGLLVGVFGTSAFILGSIVGGHFIAKKGLNRRTLIILCSAFNLPFIAYSLLAIMRPESKWVIGIAVSFEHFGYGFGFVGLILYIMQVVAPGPYKMAHYAFGSAVANAGYLISSSFSGLLSDWLGYHKFFIWVMFATIPAFIVTWLVPLTQKTDGENVLEK